MLAIKDIKESPIQIINHPILEKYGLTLQVKRDDLIHPVIQGNKWRKLKYNLLHLQKSGLEELVTFGGAFSNHLYATSMACKLFGIAGHLIVRGPELDYHNPTLKMASACGLTLHPVSRIEYRQRSSPDYLLRLQAKFENAFIIPEGGSNHFALQGIQELATSLPQSDYIMTAVGSGGTLAGLIAASKSSQVLGVTVLKGAQYLEQEIKALLPNDCFNTWGLLHDFHHGGYAKTTPELLSFCAHMKEKYALPLEPIYTGKLFFAIFSLAQQGYFDSGSVITAIHTGGLQGLDGMRYMQQGHR
ncbi:1-aminocyclopropane-1-carboxylate deaminase/D-cysteine desulfhydrase [Pseudoalteromonas sp. J010]|uniref:1-aminocyclopropane-1-carboxylate deaminase/D-cysteine desulfhydrase n=1 Tax=Pseudoalteromonas sp. J010 TaxID=998465 RepID=UPI000F648D4F|nr:pyridoxal-phosphate dependent enzyme [Pseudoalteromonas sp. J010]RRS09948.1 1-aminocyclopropane-1-carboxylate deaminase/D-cysteine desulfhydrase [Pseudoalteromonas sp. J010]